MKFMRLTEKALGEFMYNTGVTVKNILIYFYMNELSAIDYINSFQ